MKGIRSRKNRRVQPLFNRSMKKMKPSTREQTRLPSAFIAAVAWLSLPISGRAFSQGTAGFGDPLPNLTAEQQALFDAGKVAFLEIEEVEEGLGPIFNARSCGECHSMPAVGGSSTTNEIR